MDICNKFNDVLMVTLYMLSRKKHIYDQKTRYETKKTYIVHTIAFVAALFFVVPSLEKHARNISILVGSRPKVTCFNKVVYSKLNTFDITLKKFMNIQVV